MRRGGSRTLIAVCILVAGVAAAGVAEGSIGTIQPGDIVKVDGATCTLNFVYDGIGALAGRVFVGTAAHCVSSVGQSASSWPFDDFGTVAYLGDEDRAATDFAFIEVKPDFHPYVKAWVKGHPGYPTGATTSTETRVGDGVQISGHGTGFGVTYTTQERRVGVLMDDNHEMYQVTGPLVWGDSGGPLVHQPTGKALGIVSRLCFVWACTDFGPSIEGTIQKAAADGFPVALRTA